MFAMIRVVMDKVKKATLEMLKRRDQNKGKKVKLPKFDNPEKYFKAMQGANNEALSKISNMRFK
jgi:hypothetical protein